MNPWRRDKWDQWSTRDHLSINVDTNLNSNNWLITSLRTMTKSERSFVVWDKHRRWKSVSLTLRKEPIGAMKQIKFKIILKKNVREFLFRGLMENILPINCSSKMWIWSIRFHIHNTSSIDYRTAEKWKNSWRIFFPRKSTWMNDHLAEKRENSFTK